jgi:hypothetical protein
MPPQVSIAAAAIEAGIRPLIGSVCSFRTFDAESRLATVFDFGAVRISLEQGRRYAIPRHHPIFWVPIWPIAPCVPLSDRAFKNDGFAACFVPGPGREVSFLRISPAPEHPKEAPRGATHRGHRQT